MSFGKKVTGLRPIYPAGSAPSGTFVELGILKIFTFSTAITTGVTTIPANAANGDLAVTSHATGGGNIFKAIAGVWTAV